MAITGQWLSDPTRRHEYRWHDGETWTSDVSDAGVVTHDEFTTGSVERPPRRRRTWWIVGGVLVGVLVLGGLGLVMLVGLGSSLSSVDSYSEDFDGGSGDFPVIGRGDFTTAYTDGGYRLTATGAGIWGGSAVLSSTEHSSTTAQFTVTSEAGAATAAIGPSCWSADRSAVYAMVMTPGGSARLVAGDPQAPETVASRTASAQAAPRELRLTCVVRDDGRVDLTGEVDGTTVITGTASERTTAFAATGVQAFSGSARATWLIDDFSRSGPAS